MPPPPTQGPADIALQQALELFNADKTAEAIAAYEKIVHDYPTLTLVSEAQFRLGYLYYRNGDFDKSLAMLKKVVQPPASPEIQELASSMLPQVSMAKADKLPASDPARKAAFEDAIKQFDAFIQKYPNSDEIEAIVYAKALSSYQIGKYDEAAAGLRSNLLKFAKSDSALDSQYLLAITLATQASTILQDSPGDPKASAKYDEAGKLLGDIIQKRSDIALANDAQFQLGEILSNRAALTDKAAQGEMYGRAIDAYRAVQPKELVIKAQQDRIAGFLQRMHDPAVAKSLPAIKYYQRVVEHEREKLDALKSKPDQTVTAKIKVAEAFYNQQRYDEARLMLDFLKQFAEDDSQKKEILYFTTLTYAEQKNVDKAVAGYNEFNEKYKGDPIAENLPLAIGSLYLSSDPNKAIQYFKESMQLYPKGRFYSEALTQQAAAMVQLKRFDEASTAFKSLLASHPTKEIAETAELGLGTIYTMSGKLDEAMSAFKEVRDKYPGTPQAEQAAYYVGQTAIQKGDNKTAIAELTAFIEKYPTGELTPNAIFYLASAELASADKEDALTKFKEVGDKFPKTQVAQFSYFKRSEILGGEQKYDEMTAVMKEFISKYPDSENLYFAYDSIGQIQVNANQAQDAIATYTEFVDKRGQDPHAAEALLKISDLWRRYADATGRYLVLNEQQRVEWTKGVNGSIAAAEKLISDFSESPQVALALHTLLADQQLLLTAKLKTDSDVEQYFMDLSKKFASKPTARSKIIFALASYTYQKDKAKALEQMNAAYDPKLIYSPADIDLYGQALLEENKVADAQKVYAKLAADYPNPPGVAPDKAPADIAEAQSIALYGTGTCLQKQGNTKAAGDAFDQLKKLYPWSPKILEASFGIAQSLYQQKKYDEAIALLIPIMRAQSASATAELRANAMLLGGQIQEDKHDIEAAIDYYIKVASYYESVAPAASEGLWRGGQLLEQQAAKLPDTGAVTKSGQLAKAVKAYNDIITKYPTSPYVDKAKQRLAALKPAGK
ncbi:MAG: tetratricopeptide repeat protein [Chthoniobacteraceae bacterium]